MLEPPLGSHLVTSRHLYTHHGIYVGGGAVVHYAGLADGLKKGPVEETTIERFADGHGFRVKDHSAPRYTGAAAVLRARSRLGENLYNLFSCNCEHFAEWVIHDRHLSQQVEVGAGLGSAGMTAAAGKAAIAAVPALAAGTTVATSGAGLMSGLATVGGAVGGGAAAGIGMLALAPAAGAAYAINNTVLRDSDAHDDAEREARGMARKATVAGAVGGAAASVAAVAAVGVPGISAVGITTGLAGVGSVVGGGMAAGIVVAAAAPVAVAAAVGFGVYKLARFFRANDKEDKKDKA
jgi:hypothetical protein